MLRVVREELKAIMAVEGEPLFSRIYRWERSMPQYLVGHGAKLSRMEDRTNRLPGLYLTGCAYRGIGLPDCVHDAELTADKALAFLFPAS